MLCDNLEGWEGERGGRFKREETYVYLRLIHADVWQKPTQYCKAIILQLKINKFLQKEVETIKLVVQRSMFHIKMLPMGKKKKKSHWAKFVLDLFWSILLSLFILP